MHGKKDAKPDPNTIKQLRSRAKQLVGYNKFLKEKNEFLHTTVASHKELLSAFLERPPPKVSDADFILGKIAASTRTLEFINHKLDNDNLVLLAQVDQYKKQIEEEETKSSEEIDALESKNFILTNLLEKQDHIIVDLESKLKDSKERSQSNVKVLEKRILDPTQQTLILHHELQACRTAFKRLTKGLNAEINKNVKLERYSKSLREQNDYLVSIIKGLCVNSDKPTDNTEGIPGVDLDTLKQILMEPLSDPMMPEEIKVKADTSVNIQKEDDINLSFASSIGAPLPVKNDLSKSHDRIKCQIPTLDFSKLKQPEVKVVVKKEEKVGKRVLAKSFIDPHISKKKELIRPELGYLGD